MANLTFGEQVKIVLGRKGMTIKELAELMEQHTGKSMSRQNMTQRLGRDNFQEQDMRLIAKILGCPFQLSILEEEWDTEEFRPAKRVAPVQKAETQETEAYLEQDMTVGELLELHKGLEHAGEKIPQSLEEKEREMLRKGVRGYLRKTHSETTAKQETEAEVLGEVNPYTGKEYQHNSVRMHPKRIGYVQVYDSELHKWSDMTEWAFIGYEERKKVLQGDAYQPPVYLD